MIRRTHLPILIAVALGLFSIAASPQQAEQGPQISWWVWLVGISLFLLITFIIFIVLEWGEVRKRDDDEID